jgi:hypothetical protein
MSNFIVLNKNSNYYNIESEHGDIVAQKLMIDRLMKILKVLLEMILNMIL